MYIDCRYGQLHLTTAYPANGGFDEAHPIVFLHADSGTGGDFSRCAELLGTDRRTCRVAGRRMPRSPGCRSPALPSRSST
jgi:hypothetical protein